MAIALLGKRPTMMVSTMPMLIQPSSAKTRGRARRNIGANSRRRAFADVGAESDILSGSASMILAGAGVKPNRLEAGVEFQSQPHPPERPAESFQSGRGSAW